MCALIFIEAGGIIKCLKITEMPHKHMHFKAHEPFYVSIFHIIQLNGRSFLYWAYWVYFLNLSIVFQIDVMFYNVKMAFE